MKLTTQQAQNLSQYIFKELGQFNHDASLTVAKKEDCLRELLRNEDQESFYSFLDRVHDIPNTTDAVRTLRRLHDLHHNNPIYIHPRKIQSVIAFLGPSQEYLDTQIDHARIISEELLMKTANSIRGSIRQGQFRDEHQAWKQQLTTLNTNPYWRLTFNNLSPEYYYTFDLRIKHTLLKSYRPIFLELQKRGLPFLELIKLPLHTLFALFKNPLLITKEGVTAKTLHELEPDYLLNDNQQMFLTEYCIKPQLELIAESDLIDDGTKHLYLSRAFTENTRSFYCHLDQLHQPKKPESKELLLAFKYIHDMLYNNLIYIHPTFKPAISAAGIDKHGPFSESSLENILGCTLQAAKLASGMMIRLRRNKDLEQEQEQRLALETHTPYFACWRSYDLPMSSPGKVLPTLESPIALPSYTACLEAFGTHQYVKETYKSWDSEAKAALLAHPKNAFDVAEAIRLHGHDAVLEDRVVADSIAHLDTLRAVFGIVTHKELFNYLILDHNNNRVDTLTNNETLFKTFAEALGQPGTELLNQIGKIPGDTIDLLVKRLKACQNQSGHDFSPLIAIITVHDNKITNFGSWLLLVLLGDEALSTLKRKHDTIARYPQFLKWFCALCKHIDWNILTEQSPEALRSLVKHSKLILLLINNYHCNPRFCLSISPDTLNFTFSQPNFLKLVNHGANPDKLIKKSKAELQNIFTRFQAMILLSNIRCHVNSREPISLDEQLALNDNKHHILCKLSSAGIIQQLINLQTPLQDIISLTEIQLYALEKYILGAEDKQEQIALIAKSVRKNQFSLADIADISRDNTKLTLILQNSQAISHLLSQLNSLEEHSHPNHITLSYFTHFDTVTLSSLLKHPIMEQEDSSPILSHLCSMAHAICYLSPKTTSLDEHFLTFLIALIQMDGVVSLLHPLAMHGDIQRAYKIYKATKLSVETMASFFKTMTDLRAADEPVNPQHNRICDTISINLLKLACYIELNKKITTTSILSTTGAALNGRLLENTRVLELAHRIASHNANTTTTISFSKICAVLSMHGGLQENLKTIVGEHANDYHMLWLQPKNIVATEELLKAGYSWPQLLSLSQSSINLAIHSKNILIERGINNAQKRKEILSILHWLAQVFPTATPDNFILLLHDNDSLLSLCRSTYDSIKERTRQSFYFNNEFVSLISSLCDTKLSPKLQLLARQGDILCAYEAHRTERLNFDSTVSFLELVADLRNKATHSLRPDLLLDLVEYVENYNEEDVEGISAQDLYTLLNTSGDLSENLTSAFRTNARSCLAVWLDPKNLPSTRDLLNAGYHFSELALLDNARSISLAIRSKDTLVMRGRSRSAIDGRQWLQALNYLVKILPDATPDTFVELLNSPIAVFHDVVQLYNRGFNNLSAYASKLPQNIRHPRIKSRAMLLLNALQSHFTSLNDIACIQKLSPNKTIRLLIILKHIPIEKILHPQRIRDALLHPNVADSSETAQLPFVKLYKRNRSLDQLAWLPKKLLKQLNNREDTRKKIHILEAMMALPENRRQPFNRAYKALIQYFHVLEQNDDRAVAPSPEQIAKCIMAFLDCSTDALDRLSYILKSRLKERLPLLANNPDAVRFLLERNLTTPNHLLSLIPLNRLPHLLLPIQDMINRSQHIPLYQHTQRLKTIVAQHALKPKKAYTAIRKKRIKQWVLTATLAAVLGGGSSVPAIILPLVFATAPLSSPASIALLTTGAVVFALTVLVTSFASIHAHRSIKKFPKSHFWETERVRVQVSPGP